ncbi:unnamed protein product [Amoebophrya sp. A120]|nr:unnamed protein product [Amoebophrya sp. A120]|eukprot:GSA120T00018217001.1
MSPGTTNADPSEDHGDKNALATEREKQHYRGGEADNLTGVDAGGTATVHRSEDLQEDELYNDPMISELQLSAATTKNPDEKTKPSDLDSSFRTRIKIVDEELKEENVGSCLTYVCSVSTGGGGGSAATNGYDFQYTLDVDKPCKLTSPDTTGDNASCEAVCCSYFYCFVNLRDLGVDYEMAGLNDKTRTGVAFNACADQRTVKFLKVPAFEDQGGGPGETAGDNRIEVDKFLELENFVSVPDCYHRTGFFHYPVVGTETKHALQVLKRQKQVDSNVDTTASGPVDFDNFSLREHLPVASALTTRNLPDDSPTIDEIRDAARTNAQVANNDETLEVQLGLRGFYNIHSHAFAWEDPILKVQGEGKLAGDIHQQLGKKRDEYKPMDLSVANPVQGPKAVLGKTLRLVVADSRAHWHLPKWSKRYEGMKTGATGGGERSGASTFSASDYQLPYTREAELAFAETGKKDGIPIKQCCSFIVQAMTSPNFLSNDLELTEKFVVQNCVVFAKNMHEHLFGKEPTAAEQAAIDAATTPVGPEALPPAGVRNNVGAPEVPNADCEVGPWAAVGACSKTCGIYDNTQVRIRQVTYPQSGNGKKCPALQETVPCTLEAYTGECSVDCEATDWSPPEYGSCSVGPIKGPGGAVLFAKRCRKTRTREIKTPPTGPDAAPCPGNNEELEQAKLCTINDDTWKECCEDNAGAEWTEWTACTKTCGGEDEMKSRTKTEYKYLIQDPVQCVSEVTRDTARCHEGPQPDCPRDCKLSHWTEWGECSSTCGKGQHTRTRTVVQQPIGDGEQCPDSATEKSAYEETGECENTIECVPKVDCALEEKYVAPVAQENNNGNDNTEEGGWSPCSKTCGGGAKFRIKFVDQLPQGSGKSCQKLFGKGEGITDAAVVAKEDITISWGYIDAGANEIKGAHYTDGTPVEIINAEQEQSQSSGSVSTSKLKMYMKETADCNREVKCPDPVDCVMKNWEAWTECSKSCDGGTRTRARYVKTPPKEGRPKCQDVDLYKIENLQKGYANGTAPHFEWLSTGGGGQEQHDGKLHQKETARCNEIHCPCAMEEWAADWTTCSVTCGPHGKQTRERKVSTLGGYADLTGCKSLFGDESKAGVQHDNGVYIIRDADGITRQWEEKSPLENSIQKETRKCNNFPCDDQPTGDAATTVAPPEDGPPACVLDEHWWKADSCGCQWRGVSSPATGTCFNGEDGAVYAVYSNAAANCPACKGRPASVSTPYILSDKSCEDDKCRVGSARAPAFASGWVPPLPPKSGETVPGYRTLVNTDIRDLFASQEAYWNYVNDIAAQQAVLEASQKKQQSNFFGLPTFGLR